MGKVSRKFVVKEFYVPHKIIDKSNGHILVRPASFYYQIQPLNGYIEGQYKYRYRFQALEALKIQNKARYGLSIIDENDPDYNTGGLTIAQEKALEKWYNT